MALNRLRYPVCQVAKRGYSAQPQIQPKDIQCTEAQCTTLPNKISVSTLDLNGPLARLIVAFGVGPRHESPQNQGIVHVIRTLAGFSTSKCTGFAIWKNSQQNGIHFYCTGDREVTAFHAVGVRSKIKDTLKYLSAMVSTPAFKRWEVSDNLPRLQYEVKGMHPFVRVMENLHEAAYRTGLGYSLYVAEDKIGMHTSDMLDNFYTTGFTANRASVLAYNICENDSLEFAKSLELPSNDLPDGNSKYFGGEIRQNVKSDFAHIAIATEGPGYKDLKNHLIYSVLQYVYGVKPMVSWGNSQSLLFKAVQPVAPDAGVSCFKATYSDSGLFGFMISSFANNAGKAVEAAFKVMKSGSIPEADIKRAINMLKADIHYRNYESSDNFMFEMSQQMVRQKLVLPASVFIEAVDKLTTADVSNAARKIANGKFSLSAYGDLSEVPYLDSLK